MKQIWTYCISLFFAFCVCQTASAQVLDKKITLPATELTGLTLVKAIKSQAGLRFSYVEAVNAKLAAVAKAGSLQLTVKEALELIKATCGISYEINGEYITLLQNSASTPAPVKKKSDGHIAGRIIDEETNQSVVGATVMIGKKAVSADVDGSFNIDLSPGEYDATVSSIGYGKKIITGIDIKGGESVELNIVLKREKGQLAGVVVTGSARKEGVVALYTAQKNRASISDGISAEQIARTPDNNIGQVLKRVSGVATVDNKYVIVRGMTERYNQAMIDGIVVPSTDMNRRNFSFDVIPAELVSNVVVNKTAVADASSEFSGGQVIVNTLDMPVQDFTQIAAGAGFNSLTTGKTFLQGGGRGSRDYLSFDDGRRAQPQNIKTWLLITNTTPTPDFAVPQSKLFRSEGLRIYEYNGQPNQNYRISLGRVFRLDNEKKFGFVAGINLRDNQEINEIKTTRSSYLYSVDSAQYGYGKSYKFSSNLAGLLNMSFIGKSTRISFKNLYTRTFHDDLFDLMVYDNDPTHNMNRQILIDPESTWLLQNKLEGEHNLTEKGLKLSWSGAVTKIGQQIQDRRMLSYGDISLNGEIVYLAPSLNTRNRQDTDPDYRMYTDLGETDYNWSLNLIQPFRFLKEQSLLKMGYSGWFKKRSLNSLMAVTYTDDYAPMAVTYDQVLSPENIGTGKGQAYYYVSTDLNGQQYAGTSHYHSAFLMLDQRLFSKWRLVYGIRLENFNLASSQDAFRKQAERNPSANAWKNPYITGEKNWRFLPSVNLAYSLNSKMNFRLAYSTTMVRPDFRETSYFGLFDPALQANIFGWNVVSTKIYNTDFRYEYYPSPGEIFSISAFYKKFDKPLELVLIWNDHNYRFQNQRSAINYGVELEFRKSLGFIADRNWLNNLTLFGNGSRVWSEVNAVDYLFENNQVVARDVPALKRPLYGQTPYTINAGIAYDAKAVGVNIVYNRIGPMPYTLNINPNLIEYQNSRNLLDLQLYTRLLRSKAEIKLNIANLLNVPTLYYLNYDEYKIEQGVTKERINGTDNFERDKGDVVRYQVNTGRNASITFSYRF